MRKIQLLLICLLLMLTKTKAQVTVGTENNLSLLYQYLPIDLAGNYNYSQTIYLASEIYTSGNITTLTYYTTPSTTISNSNNWTVFVGHTTKNTFSNTSDWIPKVTLTQVYSGIVTISGGAVTISFDSPFAYNGTDNLVVAVYENTPNSNGANDDFYCSAVTGNRSLLLRSPINNINLVTPSAATFIITNIANVTFGGISHPGPPPSMLNVLDFTTNSANLTWSENGTATVWNIEWDTLGFTLGTGNMITGVTTNPFNLTGLDPGRYYQFYVQADYGVSGLSYWAGPYSFYTVGIPQFKFHLAFEDATGAKDTVWLVFDTLATSGYDTIFGEFTVNLPTNTFQVYLNGIKKVSAVPTNYKSGGFQILAQNYVYPLTLTWDSALLYTNNLPFTIGHAWLDNEWFFFNNNWAPNHLFNMLWDNYVDLPKFYYGSQEQFPMSFNMGEGSGGVSIKEENNNNVSIILFPNPTNNKFEIELKGELEHNNQLRLMDVNGKLIKELSFLSNKIKVDVSTLPKGIYFIEVFNNNFSYQEKLLKY